MVLVFGSAVRLTVNSTRLEARPEARLRCVYVCVGPNQTSAAQHKLLTVTVNRPIGPLSTFRRLDATRLLTTFPFTIGVP
jgi:hypothetical protein